MPGDICIRPQAKKDIVDQAFFIAEGSSPAADRFLDALRQSIELLAEMPQIGAPRQFRSPALEGIRMWPVKGYRKLLIFYRPDENGIDVIRILHASRDIPGILEEDSKE